LIRIELFGNLRIACDGQAVGSVNTNRLHSLLAYLVLNGGAPQSREQLAFRLWPESIESQARTNLRQLLHHLRRALPPEHCLLTSDNHTVQWPRDPSCSVDVLEFEAALSQAAAARARGEPAPERAALEEAARLYQDDLLPPLYDEWLQPKREQYRQQLFQALARLSALAEEQRDYPAAIHHAERLVAQDPLSEAHHQSLIRLHAANRDRASALRAYHQCMRVLRRELGVEPCAATRELFERVLKTETPVPVPTEAPPSASTAFLPLVGRKKEWEKLLECRRATVRRRPLFAVISGEPGIGKSRLAEELYASWTAEGLPAARTRCYASQGHMAYAPIAEWLRAKDVETARAQLSQAQLSELARVLPEILDAHPSLGRPRPLTESWERLHFYDSLNAAFGKTDKPLLLLIDDLQWCDTDSFEWLHSLFRSPAAARTLVLGTLRAEEAGRDHPYTRLFGTLQQADQAVEIPLLPLDAAETSELARQVSGKLNPDDLGELYKATKGNPLFVVESLRAGLRNPADAPRIHAVIAARLAQLSKPSYELAGMAGAIGRAFSFDLLAKATDWDEDSLSRALDELWQRRIIESHGSAEYDFTHDRLREVAYSELSVVRRRYLHRRLARALQEIYAGDLEGQSAQLAAHFEAAGMAEEAIERYRVAAVYNRQRYADAEASGLLRRALVLCRNLPESVQRMEQELELLVNLGAVLVTTHGYAMPEVGETYERALGLSRQLGEDNHIFAVLSGYWVFHVVRGALEQSLQVGQEFLERAGKSEVPALTMAGNLVMGSSLFHLGQPVAALRHIDAALALQPCGGHSVVSLFAGPDIGVFSGCYRAHLQWHLGRVEEAAASMQQALEAAAKVGHPFSRAIALNYSAMLHAFRGDSAGALVWAEQAVALCQAHQFAYYLSMAEILAGWAASMVGRVEEGPPQMRRGFERFRSTGAEIRLPFYLGLFAQTAALTGNFGEAMANLSNAFAFQSKNGEMWAASDLHRIQGDILRLTAGEEQARACYQKAVEAARQIGVCSFEQRALERLKSCRTANAAGIERS
jgi:DNA-binding SARP family transcriptional activator/predicted ATPase